MKKDKKVRKIAFVTYNRIGDGQYNNGVLKKGNLEIYIAQNGHMAKWAVPGKNIEEDKRIRRETALEVVRRYDLKDMDHVFLYVGAKGAEVAIGQTANINPKKITYVMCNCERQMKEAMIKKLGNANAEIITCECGE